MIQLFLFQSHIWPPKYTKFQYELKKIWFFIMKFYINWLSTERRWFQIKLLYIFGDQHWKLNMYIKISIICSVTKRFILTSKEVYIDRFCRYLIFPIKTKTKIARKSMTFAAHNIQRNSNRRQIVANTRYSCILWRSTTCLAIA